jgi:hypothetical protein
MQNTIALHLPVSARRISLNINFGALWVLFSIMAVCLLAFYIFQMNNFVSKSYSLKNLEKQANGLTQEKEKTEMRLASLASLDKIGELVESRQFVKINAIHYVQAKDTSLALSK